MKLIGFTRSNFTARDTGTEITGYTVYLADEIPASRGKGLEVSREYLTDKKVADRKINLDQLYGKAIRASYNRWGKLDNISLAD